jgi:hypothetical protein
MSVRSCKVTIEDMNGVSHTVEVTAETLYEAVALGMAAIRTKEWVTGIAQGLNPVKVRVTNVAVEHEVRLMDFTKWLGRSGGSPRERRNANGFGRFLGWRSRMVGSDYATRGPFVFCRRTRRSSFGANVGTGQILDRLIQALYFMRPFACSFPRNGGKPLRTAL